MKMLEMTSRDVLSALQDFDCVLSLVELVKKESAIIRRLEESVLTKDSTLRYAYTVLKTHIRFMQDTDEAPEPREESIRIQRVIISILAGRISLRAAIFAVIEERRRKKSPRTLFDQHSRPGTGRELSPDSLDGDE